MRVDDAALRDALVGLGVFSETQPKSAEVHINNQKRWVSGFALNPTYEASKISCLLNFKSRPYWD
jgi:hypothetical protein